MIIEIKATLRGIQVYYAEAWFPLLGWTLGSPLESKMGPNGETHKLYYIT